MKKFLFISLAVILALSVGLMGCTGEEEEEEEEPWDSEIELYFHATISNSSSICQKVINPWVAELEAITGTDGGTFDVTIDYSDAPFNAAGSLAGLATGNADLGQLSGETFTLGGAGYLPFAYDCMNETAYVMYNLWTENNGVWDVNGELDGVKILIAAPLWGTELWTTNHDNGGNVTTAADVASSPISALPMNLRTDGNSVESDTIRALGGVPVHLGTSDLGGALSGGTIDGVGFTWSGLAGFSGVNPNCAYVTHLDMYYRPYSIAMCKDTYDDLPDAAKAAIDSMSGAAKSMEYANAHETGVAGAIMGAKGTGKYYKPTAGELQTFKDATVNVDEWWAGNISLVGFDGAGILTRIAQLIAAAP